MTNIHQGHRKVFVKGLILLCSPKGTVGFAQFSGTCARSCAKRLVWMMFSGWDEQAKH